jgi:solute:Na+ symporter, SSS family
VYIALTSFVINLVVVIVLTLVLRALKVPEGVDSTHPTDYLADVGDPGVKDLPEILDEGGAAPARP